MRGGRGGGAEKQSTPTNQSPPGPSHTEICMPQREDREASPGRIGECVACPALRDPEDACCCACACRQSARAGHVQLPVCCRWFGWGRGMGEGGGWCGEVGKGRMQAGSKAARQKCGVKASKRAASCCKCFSCPSPGQCKAKRGAGERGKACVAQKKAQRKVRRVPRVCKEKESACACVHASCA